METLAKHFREITRAAFARYGFQQAEIVASWPEIVGEDLARVSAPERIKWPRQAGEEAQKGGGTLVIRAAPGRALDLQYEASRIIARVNGFFGYGAIAKLTVVQSAELSTALRRVPVLAEKPVCEQQLETVEDEGLKAALERWGRGVAASRQSSPQGK